MSATVDGEIIRLSGACRVEDAETVLSLILSGRDRAVDVSAVTHLHAAVLQVLLAYRPRLVGAPADRFVQNCLPPLLRRGTGA